MRVLLGFAPRAMGRARNALASLALCCWAVSTAGEGLLRPVAEALSAEKRVELAADPWLMRWRVVGMDSDAVFGPAAGAEPLAFNLFGDVEVRARVGSAKRLDGGSRFLAGVLEGGGHFTLFRHATGIVRGEFHSAEGVYTLRSQGPASVLVRQEDSSKLPGCGNEGVVGEAGVAAPGSTGIGRSGSPPLKSGRIGKLRPPTLSRSVPAALAASEMESKPIDVLVVYTQRVEDHEGGPAEVQATIENEMAKTNQVLENSGLSHRRMRLAAVEKVDYEQREYLYVDARHLIRASSDNDDGKDYGALDEVFPLIEDHQADLVHLVVRDRREACGRANNYAGRFDYEIQTGCAHSDDYDLCLYNARRRIWKSYIYSISAVKCLSFFTFTHELGHTLGLWHDRGDYGWEDRDEAYYIERGFFPFFKPYAFGHQNLDFSEVCQYTVMSIATACVTAGNLDGQGIPYFSNPDIFYPHPGDRYATFPFNPGTPMGVSGDEFTVRSDGPVNASRAIDEVWDIVAALSEPDATSLPPGWPASPRPPRVADPLPDQALIIGRRAELDLLLHFSGEQAIYEVESSDAGVVRPTVAGRLLTLVPVAIGRAEVTVTAGNANGHFAQDRFVAEVKPRPFRDCAECPEVVAVPAGSFMQGAPVEEEGSQPNERPMRQVDFAAPFAIGVYEVTFEQWDACVAAGGCGGYEPLSRHRGSARANRPVRELSWEDAQAYVGWLSEHTGEAYRLPSESEWEYAARAGTRTPFHFGETISTGQASYDGSVAYGNGGVGERPSYSSPVGSFPANAWGLHDVHGNVYEWTMDCYDRDSYADGPTDGRAWEAGDCDYRMMRGGWFASPPAEVRSAHRVLGEVDYNVGLAGIRVVRAVPESAAVAVPDARLREHIAGNLGLASGALITEEDLAGLRELRAPSANVADLAGLELAVNLVTLDLSGNEIADVSALSGLQALRGLDLAGNALADAGPLAGLASLAELDLSGNGLADVSALSGLAGLTELDLAGNELRDVSPLAGLAALRTLHLDGNAVADVSALASLDRLSFLVLRGNAVSDISPLLESGLPGSENYVDLRGNPLGDGHLDHVAALREAGAAVLFDDGGHRVPLFPSAAGSAVAGFVRVINHSDDAGAVSIEAVDEAGERRGPVSLAIGAGEALHFNAGDLEQGDSARGLGGIGEAAGGWRLVLRSELDIEVLGYARTPDGFVTSLHDLAPESHGTSAAPTFNPGSNRRQVSKLRLVNPTAWDRRAAVSAWDDAGSVRANSLLVPANRTLELSAAQLEAGQETGEGAAEFAGLGDGAGKWRLEVHAPGQRVMSLLQSPTGHLANISTRTAVSPWRVRDHLAWERGGRYRVPLFLAAGSDIQGFLRIVNLHGESAAITLRALDGAGAARESVALTLGGGEVLHFTSGDMENGNADKGLPGVGPGAGDWHLEASGNRRFEVLAYARTADGFVTSLHDVAPRAEDGSLWIPFFNPGSNRAQASRLRLVNWGETATEATITGIDDAGDSPGSAVRVRVPGRSARDYMAWELETGEGAGLSGALGDGRGKWRLRVSSPGDIEAMSLLGLPTGHVTNLSTTPRFPAE